jgi:hypothetical protein
VILIGAARSGTKIVRDTLAVATGAGTVPYDIGYVWRAGNESAPDDVLEPSQLSSKAQQFVAGFVDGYAAGVVPTVIEKTVGNSLRVPYVASAFPDAVFIHLIRDGVDVAESTRRQWIAPTDWRYLARKARHFPFRLVPGYGVRYAQSLASRVRRTDRRVGSWGPRYPGIDEDLASEDLLVVCGRQWKASVLHARQAFASLDVPVLEVRYETLVRDPMSTIKEVAEFAELAVGSDSLGQAAASVTSARVGAGRRALEVSERAALGRELDQLLDVCGYARCGDAMQNGVG